jgi:hypothetical protein
MESLSDVFLPCPVNVRHPLAQKLVGWWMGLPGLEGGNMVYNLAPHKGYNPGVFVNGVKWAPSPFGLAMSFNGIIGRVDCSGDGTGNGNTFYDITANQADANHTMVAMACNNTLGNDQYDQVVYSVGTNQFFIGTLGLGTGRTNGFIWNSSLRSTSAPLPVGTWNTHAIVRDHWNGPALYTNGVRDTAVFSGGFFGWVRPTKQQIGRRYDGIGPNPTFNGKIHSVMVWQRALTAGDMKDLNILMRNGYIGLLNRFEPTKLIFNIPVSATITAVCTMTGGLTTATVPGDGDIYDPENLRGMFNFLLPIVNQQLQTNYTTCDVKFVFANGREARFPDCN